MPFTDLPVELFLDNILPLLPTRDLLNLTAVNHFFYQLGSDDALWRGKLNEDFNFPSSETARRTGWKFLYERLYTPKVYVWGEKGHGRLGLAKPPQTAVWKGVPFPVSLRFPGVRIVSLIAGGWSFHALDSLGDIYVWGQLDGNSVALRSEGFSSPHKKAEQPLRLQLPVKFRNISCGRFHATAMDATAQVWIFTSWGRPFRLVSSLLDRSSPETTPAQIDSGWTFTAVLTQSGDVLVGWPFSNPIQQVISTTNEELDQHASPGARAGVSSENPGVIPCHWWVMQDVQLTRLPAIHAASLPLFTGSGLEEEQLAEETKLIKIASLDNTIIGLTNKGHVLRFTITDGDGFGPNERWEYLPYFCELEKVREHPTFRQQGQQSALQPPDSLLITHISAQFQTFVAYSTGETSVVLMGKLNEGPRPHDPESPFIPKIVPELQYKSVISVVLGDYHYGALTSTGKLLTWGQFSNGALGLGEPSKIELGRAGGYESEERLRAATRQSALLFPPPDVQTPTEVHFNHGETAPREKYCFAAAAGGWHMGAIVVDLEPGEHEDEDVTQEIPGAFPAEGSGQRIELPEAHYGLGQLPLFPIRGGMTGLRVGYAGRGMHRGLPPTRGGGGGAQG